MDHDGGGDGEVTLPELKVGFQRLSILMREEDIERVFHGLDPDGSGSITVQEFIGAITTHESARKRREEAECLRVMAFSKINKLKDEKDAFANKIAKQQNYGVFS